MDFLLKVVVSKVWKSLIDDMYESCSCDFLKSTKCVLMLSDLIEDPRETIV